MARRSDADETDIDRDDARRYEALESDLGIDKDDLDSELVRQPTSFLEVAKSVAMSISVRDQAKDIVKRTEAKRYSELRAESEAKVTEANLAKMLEIDPAVIKATDYYRRTCLDADRWQALRDSWVQRSYALKDLVTLHVSSYAQTDTSTAGSRKTLAESDAARDRRILADARRARNEARGGSRRVPVSD